MLNDRSKNIIHIIVSTLFSALLVSAVMFELDCTVFLGDILRRSLTIPLGYFFLISLSNILADLTCIHWHIQTIYAVILDSGFRNALVTDE